MIRLNPRHWRTVDSYFIEFNTLPYLVKDAIWFSSKVRVPSYINHVWSGVWYLIMKRGRNDKA